MRKWFSWGTALLLCLLLTGAALGESATETDLETPADPVLQVDLSLQMEAISQFGETRLTQANNLLKHLTLQLQTGLDDAVHGEGIRILVDEDPAATIEITEDENGSVFTLDGAGSYHSADDTAAQLFDADFELAFGNMRYEYLTIADDVVTLAEAMIDQNSDHTARKSVQSKVRGMGTATLKHTITYKAAEVDAFAQALLTACPEGTLKQLLTGLTFTDKQELRVLHDSKGRVLKIAYEGTCGTDADHQRKVTVSWLLLRTDTKTKDNLSITSPAKSGSDKNTITFVRTDETDNGAREVTISYKETARIDGVTTVDTLELSLKQSKKGLVTGTATLKEKGSDETLTLILTPNLTIDEDASTVEGTLTFDYQRDKESLYKGTIQVNAAPAVPWTVTAASDTRLTSDADAAAAVEAVQSKFTHELICRLLVLPDPDADYLLADFDEETRTKLIQQAEEALRKE